MEKRRIQIRGAPAIIKPLFADEVMVGITLKASKERNEKGKIEKEGHVKLGFIDTVRGQFVAEVVISPMTAKGLMKILGDNLKKLDEELKSGELPKIAKTAATTEALGYIG